MSVSDNVALAIAGRRVAQDKVTDLERTVRLLTLGWESEREKTQSLAFLLEIERRHTIAAELECQRDEAVAIANGHRIAKAG